MPVPEETCVITVTYGARHEYVRQLFAAATRNGVGHIVVVDNGCDDRSRPQLRQLAEQSANNHATILSLAENRGSATGFSTGLRYVAEQTDYPYVWLLDDDNIPDPAALRSLLDAHRQLLETHRGAICLVSLREAQPWLRRIAAGESATTVFLRRSSFCGFHVADVLRLGWTKFRRQSSQARGLADQPIPLRFSPYGGLWMPTQLLSEVGYPDERLVLYHDDTEFTSRLVRDGAQLFLVPTSRVNDAELSWAQTDAYSNGFSRMLKSDQELRVFYNTRNKVYFEVHQRENSQILQVINELAFWALLYVFSQLHGRPERRRLIRQAVRDGKRAALGQGAYPLTKSRPP